MSHPEPSKASEFETLTAAHVEHYRPPTGALTHPDSVVVTDPYDIDTPERVEARIAGQKRCSPADMAVGGVLALIASTLASGILVSFIDQTFGWSFTAVSTDSRLILLLALALLGPSLTTAAAWTVNKKADNVGDRSAPLRQLSVPADIAAAYAAFRKTTTQLRAASASEDVVAVVEARMGNMEDLLVEAARLHALGADATEDGLAVREQMVTHAAKAQSLVVMAQRKAVAIADADAGTALVLGRVPTDNAFETAGAQLAGETAFVRGVLNAESILTPNILTPASRVKEPS